MNSYPTSKLFDEATFYPPFLEDLGKCREEVIIESPYITRNRIKIFYPVFERLLRKNVKIFIVTKDLLDLDENLKYQSRAEIEIFEDIGIQTLLCIGNHHRKLAILDRKILWEGSLNILSQTHSREIMRRIDDRGATMEMFEFLKYKKVI